MHILITPDKFKGSLTAAEVCQAIEAGVKRFDSSISTTLLPLADGGEGTLEVLDACLDLETIELTVMDPLFRPVPASYKLGSGKAYIEMATASGLQLLTESERNCLYTTTFGTGELIADACQHGATEIFLFVGGSATNDAGTGMAQALGFQFLDKKGQALSGIGENLARIAHIQPPASPIVHAGISVTVVCDVQNPLFGPHGAAHVYGPQKGATPEIVELLDKGLRHIDRVFVRDLGKDLAQVPGAGAAGGIAAGAMAFFDAAIRPGIETIMALVEFEQYASAADLLITGEGKLDEQTLEGKVIAGVAQVGQKLNRPVGVICGALEVSLAQLAKRGIWQVFPLMDGEVSQHSAMTQAAKWTSIRAHQLMQQYLG